MTQPNANPLFTRSEKKRVRKKIVHKMKGAARKGFASLFGVPLSPGLGGKPATRRRARPSGVAQASSVRGDVLSALGNLGYKKPVAEKMVPHPASGEGFESLFRRAVGKNPGELIIFGNPEKVYSRRALAKHSAKNPLPLALVQGLAFGAGEKIAHVAGKKNTENRREERAAEILNVRRALTAAGFKAKVGHGRGTAHNWLDIRIAGQPFTGEAHQQVLEIAKRASGRTHGAAEHIGVEFDLRRNPGKRLRQNPGLVDAIRPGDRVTIVTPHGQQRTGRAVMPSSSGGWVLNMGGAHGTPGIASDSNIVRVSKKKGNPRPGDYDKPGTRRDLATFLKRTPKSRRGERHTELEGYVRPRGNPNATDQAKDLYEQFHKRAPEGEFDLQVSAKRRKDYTILGPLVALGVNGEKFDKINPRPDAVVQHWEKLPHMAFLTGPQVDQVKRVLDDPHQYLKEIALLASSPNGKQLYVICTEPLEIDVSQFETDTQKDFVDLGEATFVVYVAKKPHEVLEWVHVFGEEGGERPRLVFDKLTKQVLFVGGSYRVEAPGIIN
ncbi:MAG: hypothetical protein LAO20_14350 [Acidobacteriia bacterium]|nr:hypothetical protein [Terriglobia bacterium]